MSNQDRSETKRHMKRNKKKHQRYTHNDLCVHHRDIGKSHIHGLPFLFHSLDCNCRRSSDDRCDRCRNKRNNKCRIKSTHDLFIPKQFSVPFQGETTPLCPGLGLVKGQYDQGYDRGIQQNKNKCQVDFL